jgi:hypothetical protein
MGSALASFVAGALIVFTMFDQTQVTKVDKIQGSIRELRAEILSWGGARALEGTSTALLEKAKKQSSEALDESKEYVTYLEKESTKKQEDNGNTVAEYQARRKDMLFAALSATKATVSELEQLQSSLDNTGIQGQDSLVKALASEAIPLSLKTKLLKARMNSFELMMHLESKSQDTKNSKEHYQVIMQEVKGVNERLTNLDASLSLEAMDKELSSIESDIVPLTKQTPYTLLMMRVVEIGLPILLSVFSIFFVLRYSLTEKRSHEIKDLIKKRNEERLKEENNATAPVI